MSFSNILDWFRINITLPERQINLASDKALLEYLRDSSPLSGQVIYSEMVQEDPLEFRLVVASGPAQIPLVISRHQAFIHFDTVAMELPETPATILQTHMWSKRVGVALVYPYPTKSLNSEHVKFTISGGLPIARIPKSILDGFLSEFVSTCLFVLKCHFKLGPQGPVSATTQKPGWVRKAAAREASGPRASEFDLGPKKDNPQEGDTGDNQNQ